MEIRHYHQIRWRITSRYNFKKQYNTRYYTKVDRESNMKKVLIWGNVNSDERMELIFDTLIKMNYEVVFVSTKNALWNTIKTVEFIYIPPMEHRVYKFLLSSILGKRIMCDIYAPLYDTTVNDYKIYKHFHPIAILHYLRDYVAMRYSKPVIFLNEAEAEHFIKSVRVKKEKVMYKVLPLYRKEKKCS